MSKFKILKGQEIGGWKAYGFVFFRMIAGVFFTDSHFMIGLSFRRISEKDWNKMNEGILY